MKDDVRKYELKYEEIKKKLNELEKLKVKESKIEDFEPNIDSVVQNQDEIDTFFEEKNNNKFQKETKEINKQDIKEKKTNEDIKKVHKKTKDNKRTDVFIILLSFFTPTFIVLSIISLHSTYLFRKPFNYIIFSLTVISFIMLIIKLIFKIKNKGKHKKHKKISNIIFYIIISIYILGCSTFSFMLYGPVNNFRNWLITTAMTTMNHQYLCKWFYNNKEIDAVLNENYVLESGESTDASKVNKHKKIEYKNEYEKEILEHDKNADYKIIELNVNGCKGYLAAIYDPSKVKLAVTAGLGRTGQYVTTMAKNNNAILAINGGGFADPGNTSMGGTPTGITISNGKVITNGQYGTNNQGGGIIGFNNDDVLVLLKNRTANQAVSEGIRDAVSWGPFLIVNGTPSFIKGNGGWGYAARTAIGQREDGIVLFLTVDSNTTRTNGANMVDLTEIMQKYGAINAANLDGGTSTVMVMPKNQALNYNKNCKDSYCYINDPIDGGLEHRTRAIADSWIVIK